MTAVISSPRSMPASSAGEFSLTSPTIGSSTVLPTTYAKNINKTNASKKLNNGPANSVKNRCQGVLDSNLSLYDGILSN